MFGEGLDERPLVLAHEVQIQLVEAEVEIFGEPLRVLSGVGGDVHDLPDLFLADVGLGLLTRVAPALNAFSLGFPLKILMTLMLAGFMFLALPRIVSSLANQAAKTVLGVG